MRIIVHGARCGQENQLAARPDLLACKTDQFASNTGSLVCAIDCKIGQVAAKGKIGDGAGDANEKISVPRGDQKVGMPEHSFHALPILDRPSEGEGGPMQHVDKLIGVDG
jgi:hypothetical protein